MSPTDLAVSVVGDGAAFASTIADALFGALTGEAFELPLDAFSVGSGHSDGDAAGPHEYGDEGYSEGGEWGEEAEADSLLLSESEGSVAGAGGEKHKPEEVVGKTVSKGARVGGGADDKQVAPGGTVGGGGNGLACADVNESGGPTLSEDGVVSVSEEGGVSVSVSRPSRAASVDEEGHIFLRRGSAAELDAGGGFEDAVRGCVCVCVCIYVCLLCANMCV
ncbi:MAG: hypothetical protein P4L40_25705 [Terracidiphilus sp.]|nr:hypothetical protein [Terracidiphilus sp.]